MVSVSLIGVNKGDYMSEVLENILSEEAVVELIRLFEEAGEEDRNILLDVSVDKDGGVHLQMASVTVDGEEDDSCTVYAHKSGINLYVHTEKLKYFESTKLAVREIESEEGVEKLIIFVPR